MDRPQVSVAVIGMGGQGYLPACLDALRAQQGVAPLEVVVTFDPALGPLEDLTARYPEVRFVPNHGQTSPLELASQAILHTRGETVLVTKDYCVPAPDWASELILELRGPCAAAGGAVDLPEDADAVEWAFSFIDFFGYIGAVPAGPADRLTVCNAAYRRADLDRLDLDWRTHFQESAVNEALSSEQGRPLMMNPRARVTLHRRLTLPEALEERYALGRVFAAKRLEYASPAARWTYRFGAPALPALMLARMAKKAAQSRPLAKSFAKSLAPMSGLVLARAAGEFVGYATGRGSWTGAASAGKASPGSED